MNEDNKNLEENILKRFDERTEEIKKLFDEKTEETKRHFDVALEQINGRFDAFAEGQKIIEEKVEKIDLLVEDMDYVKSEIVEIKGRFRETDNELAKKADKTTVDDHETRIIKLESGALAEA